MNDELEGLNAEQIKAVTTTEGYVRLIAGAGSGKTRALTHRFAYLVNTLGIRPGNILCVTFTNKAANEIRKRIHDLTGDSDTGYIGTFHSFCNSVLLEDSHAVGYPKSFLVIDNSDIDEMLRIIYEERGLTLKDKTFADARDMFEIRKIFQEPYYYRDMIALSVNELYEKYQKATAVDDILFYGYLYQEKKCFALDYNDLIKFTLHIFHEREDIRLKWQKRLEYIMIDEFQDIDSLQYELMRVLCGYHHNLFVVGDPDQTIYTWRGANVRYLMDFDQQFPGTQTIMMMKNYRSTPQILRVANSLIEKNKNRIPKELEPVLPMGKEVQYYHAKSASLEAKWMIEQIKQLHADNVSYRDITILYRAHYVSRTLEDEFLKAKIPYTIYSGVSFYGRMEIRDALAYLRMIAYKDDMSFVRIVNKPKRNMGQRRIRFLRDYAAEHHTTLYKALTLTIDDPVFHGTGAKAFMDLIEKYAAGYGNQPVSEVLNGILEESGYEKSLRTEGDQTRLDNLAEFRQSVHEYEVSCGEETTLESYLSQAALNTVADGADNVDKVRMMTVHTAKGLEFPYVFLVGMSEGIFPSKRVRTLSAMEEERRLAFVAITRAEKGLYLSNSDGSGWDRTPRSVSRFILDIDPRLYSTDTPYSTAEVEKARKYIIRIDAGLLPEENEFPFHVGDRVMHAVFGAGTIERIDFNEEVIEVRFDKISTPRALSLRAMGKLSKIVS